LSDSFKFCPVCGHAVQKVPSIPTNKDSGNASQSSSPASDAPRVTNPQDKQYIIGVSIFAVFSVFSLLIGIVHGLPPFSILETVGWGFAAWFWYKKKPLHPAATIAVGLLGVAVIFGEIWFYVEKNAATNASDPYAQILAGADDSTKFVPPDAADIKPWQKYASCQEALRLATACEKNPSISANPFRPILAQPHQLSSITQVPKGSQLQPNDKDCDTAYDWKYYCDAKSQ
jgi:hypothetical protein